MVTIVSMLTRLIVVIISQYLPSKPLQYSWRITWTEEPDGLHVIELQRVRHN